MRWWKEMSVTDAQQPTSGRVVPYLRFIKGRNPQDNQTWFRNVFFGNEAWYPSTFGEHNVERCDVVMSVSIAGSNKGNRQFFITHDGTRMVNHSTPNTWLHYDAATIADFQVVDTTGMVFSVENTGANYLLDIS